MSDQQRVRPRVVSYFKVSESKMIVKLKNAAISRVCKFSIGVMTFLLPFPIDSECFTGSFHTVQVPNHQAFKNGDYISLGG